MVWPWWYIKKKMIEIEVFSFFLNIYSKCQAWKDKNLEIYFLSQFINQNKTLVCSMTLMIYIKKKKKIIEIEVFSFFSS